MKIPNLLPDKIDGITDCYLAGGAVLSYLTKKPVEDYDIYPKNKEGLFSVLDYLDGAGEIVNVSERALTCKLYDVNDNGKRIIVQVILGQFYPTPEDIFACFDFTVCMVAMDTETRELHSSDTALMDIASRTVRMNVGTKYPYASLARVGKYSRKGYVVPKAEFMKIGLSVANQGIPNSWDELEEAIGGSYGRQCRINVDDDKPCTLENMVEVLSGFEDTVWTEIDSGENYSWVKPEVICALVDKDSVYRYMKVDDGIMVFEESGYHFFIKQSTTTITRKGDKTVFDHFFEEDGTPKNPNWKAVGDESLIRTFKYVCETETPNVFKPCVRTQSEIRYKIGDFAAEHKDPYIFSGKNIGGYGGHAFSSNGNKDKKVCVEVLIRPSDVKAFPQSGQHIQSTAIYVRGILPEGFDEYSIGLIENPYGPAIYSSPADKDDPELNDLEDDGGLREMMDDPFGK